MKIHTIQTKSNLDNFTYLIEYDSKAICIDPYYPEQVLEILKKNNLNLISIINTHEHYDHTCGNKVLQKQTNCEIWAHENASILNIKRKLKSKDKIELSSNNFLEIMDTPGHTFTHICIKLIKNNKTIGVFSGDTLFCAGVGNCYSGDEVTLYKTISKQFHPLEEEVVIYPGHDYLLNNLGFTLSIDISNDYAKEMLKKAQEAKQNGTYIQTTIKEEKEINLFFKLKDQKVRAHLMMQDSTDEEVFLKLRDKRNNW